MQAVTISFLVIGCNFPDCLVELLSNQIVDIVFFSGGECRLAPQETRLPESELRKRNRSGGEIKELQAELVDVENHIEEKAARKAKLDELQSRWFELDRVRRRTKLNVRASRCSKLNARTLKRTSNRCPSVSPIRSTS